MDYAISFKQKFGWFILRLRIEDRVVCVRCAYEWRWRTIFGVYKRCGRLADDEGKNDGTHKHTEQKLKRFGRNFGGSAQRTGHRKRREVEEKKMTIIINN